MGPPECFSTLRIPLRRGRVWSEAENNRAARLAVVNEEMARRFWPNGDAIGQKFRLPEFKAFTSWILAANGSNDWLEIVGVAGDTPNRGLREPVAPAAYVPYTLLMGDSIELVIRTRSAPLGMVRAVRETDPFRGRRPAGPPGRKRVRTFFVPRVGRADNSWRPCSGIRNACLAHSTACSVVSYTTARRSREFSYSNGHGARNPT